MQVLAVLQDKLPVYFISQAIVWLNSITFSHWEAVRVNALNDKALTAQRPCMVSTVQANHLMFPHTTFFNSMAWFLFSLE